MSEVLHLNESECARARAAMTEFVDGDLPADQSSQLRAHLELCVECREALAGFIETDSQLTGWTQRMERENPPVIDARDQLAARIGSFPVRRWPIRGMAAAAMAIAAALVLAVIVPRVIAPERKSPPRNHAQSQFIGIPWLPPLDPQENTAVVHVNIRVATLVAAGYRVAADPDAIVPVDVLVGEDGSAHAVRVLSDINLNGTGD